MERAILARHGESELSCVGLTNGDPRVACPLTDRGCAEARQLAREIAAGLESGKLEPTAGSIEPLADEPR